MNRLMTHAMIVLCGICLLVHPSYACISPDVYISNWLFYVPLGGSADIDAPEYSGTCITDWSWSWSGSGISVESSYDEYGYYPTSSRTLSFSVAGGYYIYAYAWNSYGYDYDYALVYAVEVSSVAQSGTGSTSIYVPVGGSASLQAQPYPSVSWPSGYPTWSVVSQPGGASASVTGGSGGSATLSGLSVPGLYRPKATCGSADSGATMDVTAIDVQIDTSFPATIAFGSTLSLSSTPLGATGGTFSWSKVSGPGTVTFSPSASSEDPTFSASAAGSYTVRVQYTKGGATASETSGTINVNTVSVDITTPSSFPAHVGSGSALQLDCTPSGVTGGTYSWSKVSGPGTVSFSSTTAKNPTFTASTPGSYTVQVQYTAGGTSVTDVSGTIYVVSVDVTTPSASPAYIGSGSALQLDCTPYGAGGGTYSWSKVSGPGTVSFSSTAAKNPTFTATTAGNYVVRVQYTVGGVTVSDNSGTITVFSIDITTPANFPVYAGAGSPMQLDCTPTAAGGTYSWSKVSGPGTVSFSSTTAKNPTFSATVAGDYTVRVQYTISGVTVSGTSGTITVISVSITTPSTFPAYTPAGTALQLDCTPTVTGGAYSWFQINGPGTGSFSSTSIKNPTFTATVPGSYTIRVQYNIGPASTGASSGSINVFNVNVTTPSTFPAYVGAGSTLQLDCTPNGASGGTYSWSKVSGPGSVTFSSTTAKNPTFSAAIAGDYTVRVDYTVGGATVSSTSGTITVVGVNITTPSAFPVYVGAGSTLALDCTPSVAGGTYSWSKVSGPGTVTFSSATAKNPTFGASMPGDYVVRVQYTRNGVTASSTSGTITVIGVEITSPVSQSTYIAVDGTPASLDCSPLGVTGGSYSWSQVSGPGTGSFSNPTSQSSTFTATVPGDYVVQVEYTVDGVTVSDTSGTITVVGVDISAPSVFPAYVGAESTLQLNSTGLPAGGTYSWSKISGPGTVTFSSATAQNPTFSATVAGNYVVQVQYTVGGFPVSDTSGTITVVGIDLITPASFPAYTPVGSALQLDCTPSVAGGSYSWFKIYGPETCTLSSTTIKNPTFTASAPGTYVVRVQYSIGTASVGDSTGSIIAFDVGITTPSAFPAYVGAGQTLQLDCTPTTTGGAYSWSKVSGPGTVTFSSTTARNPTFSATEPGVYSVRVDYTIDGVTAGSTSGAITVVAVDIIAPSASPAYVGAGSALALDCTPSVAGGTYSWSKITGPGSVSFSATMYQKNPNFFATTPGDYVVQVQYTINGVTVSDSFGIIRVVGVSIATPASFPAYVGMNNPLQLDCAPSTDGGTYSWSIASGPPVGSFSNAAARNPTFTTGALGTYTLQVQYTLGGATVTATSGQINVFGVQIITPSSFPANVSVDNPLQLDCQPAGPTGSGTYNWSIASGPPVGSFSDAAARNPTFTTATVGTYTLQVQYTIDGSTVTATTGSIGAFAVDIIAPSGFPAYVGAGSPLQLGCVPMGSIGEGTYSWSKVSGPGDVTFSDAGNRTPTFTATVPGDYVVQVVYTMGGFSSSDVSGTITVAGLSLSSQCPFTQTGTFLPLIVQFEPADANFIVSLEVTQGRNKIQILQGDPNNNPAVLYDPNGPNGILTWNAASIPTNLYLMGYEVSDAKEDIQLVARYQINGGPVEISMPFTVIEMGLDVSSEEIVLGSLMDLSVYLKPEDFFYAGSFRLEVISNPEKVAIYPDGGPYTEADKLTLPAVYDWHVEAQRIRQFDVMGIQVSDSSGDVHYRLTWLSECDCYAVVVRNGSTIVPFNELIVHTDTMAVMSMSEVASQSSGTVSLTPVSPFFSPDNIRLWADPTKTVEIPYDTANGSYTWNLDTPGVTVPGTIYIEFVHYFQDQLEFELHSSELVFPVTKTVTLPVFSGLDADITRRSLGDVRLTVTNKMTSPTNPSLDLTMRGGGFDLYYRLDGAGNWQSIPTASNFVIKDLSKVPWGPTSELPVFTSSESIYGTFDPVDNAAEYKLLYTGQIAGNTYVLTVVMPGLNLLKDFPNKDLLVRFSGITHTGGQEGQFTNRTIVYEWIRQSSDYRMYWGINGDDAKQLFDGSDQVGTSANGDGRHGYLETGGSEGSEWLRIEARSTGMTWSEYMFYCGGDTGGCPQGFLPQELTNYAKGGAYAHLGGKGWNGSGGTCVIAVRGDDVLDWNSGTAYHSGDQVVWKVYDAFGTETTNEVYTCIYDHSNVEPGEATNWSSYWFAGVDPVFTPDPKTHNSPDALTIFPEDVEYLQIGGDAIPSAGRPIMYSVLSSSIAKLLDDEGHQVESITVTGPIELLPVVGLMPGETEIRAILPSEGNKVIGRINAYIGGSIQMKYSDVPTYGAGDAVGTGLTDDRQPMDYGMTSQIPPYHVTSDLTLTLKDARGNCKPGKIIAVTSNGKLAVAHEYNGPDPTVKENPPAIHVSYSNSAGEARVVLSCKPDYDFAAGVDRDELLVTVGEASRPYWTGTQQAGSYPDLTGVGVRAHENNLEFLSYVRTLDTRSAMAIPMPMINHYQYMVLAHALTGGVYQSNNDYWENSVTYQTYVGGQLTDVPGDPRGSMYPFNDTEARQEMLQYVTGGEHSQFSENQVTWTNSTAVKVSAISAEIALGMVPGWDFVDVCKEFLWKPFWKRESPNTIVGLWSFVSLAADAGYLTGVAGAPANLICGVVKAIVKIVPERLIKAIIHAGGRILDTVKKMWNLLKRIDPAGNTIVELPGKVARLITQWDRMLKTPIGNFSEDVVEQSIDVMARYTTRHLTDDAAEGISYLIAKKGSKNLAEQTLQQYSDDAAEAAFTIVRRQSTKFDALANISDTAIDDATDGLAKLVKNSADNVQDIPVSRNAFEKVMTDGVPPLTPNQQDNFFKKIKNWENTSAQLADAADGARRWLDEPALGPQKLSEATDALSAQAGEEYMAVVGRHYASNPAGANVNRINDSLTALKADIQTTVGAGSDVAAHLSSDPAAMKRFQTLRCLDPADMTQAQRDFLTAIRNSIPAPDAGTRMQKAISIEEFQRYATGEFDTITGSVAVRSHVSDLGTSADDVISGLRLDYSGSNFAGSKSYATLEFDLPNADDVSIPYSQSMGGTVTDAYPRTGNGFIATVDGKIRPEYTLGGGIDVSNGTVLKKYAPDGTLLGSSTYVTDAWVPPLSGL